MKKLYFSLLLTMFCAGLASALQGKWVYSCQSLGTYEGRMVFLNLWQRSDKSVTAVFSQAKDMTSKKNHFLTVDKIITGKTRFSGSPALIDGKGFEFTVDQDSRNNAWVNYVHNNKAKHIALYCGAR